jgi:hypothetical protein
MSMAFPPLASRAGAGGRGAGKKKLFPKKGKVQLSQTGNKPAAKKPAAKHIFSFSSAWAHSMAQFPFLICLAGILS